MCGDTYCYSCGPAQGNHRCEICGKWDEDGGCTTPDECTAKANEMYAEMQAEQQRFDEEADEHGELVGKAHPAQTQEMWEEIGRGS